jgi:hypothetical protein
MNNIISIGKVTILSVQVLVLLLLVGPLECDMGLHAHILISLKVFVQDLLRVGQQLLIIPDGPVLLFPLLLLQYLIHLLIDGLVMVAAAPDHGLGLAGRHRSLLTLAAARLLVPQE